jgi:hypothetical protein
MKLVRSIKPVVTVCHSWADILKVSLWIVKYSEILLHVDQFTLKTETLRFNWNVGNHAQF